MGIYLIPGNEGVRTKRNRTYVDKSGMIALINGRINTPDKLVCVSRPRRFGKSTAAQMVSAYYDCGRDSSGLFDDLEICGLLVDNLVNLVEKTRRKVVLIVDFNPNSVMRAARRGKFRSYWSESSSAGSLLSYIDMDFDGLSEVVWNLMRGKENKSKI